MSQNSNFSEILTEVSKFNEELNKCVNCGMCQSVCPTYLADGYEGLTARGKIELIKKMRDGAIEPSSQIAALFDNCLSCYACQTVCPASVKTENLWTAARQDLRKYNHKNLLKSTALNLTIGMPSVFNTLVKSFASIGSSLTGGMLSPQAPLLKRIERELFEVPNPRGTIGLMPGCSCNYFKNQITIKTIEILNLCNFNVIIPKRQVCCGAPAVNNGNWKLARKLAIRNREIFSFYDCDFITSTDSTCAETMKRDYLHLFEEGSDEQFKQMNFANRVIELGHLLYKLLKSYDINVRSKFDSVTLHQSCHSTHIEGGNNWKDVLEMIPQLKFNEAKEATLCCGFGGSYSFFFKETSNIIAAKKMENLTNAKSQVSLVSSPGCLIHLESFQKRSKKFDELKLLHTIEILDIVN